MDGLPITIRENNEKTIYYAAYSKDSDNVANSSSGGVFYELCKSVIAREGVVYGASQKNVREVVHERAENLDDVKKFRRSKYIRSKILNSYENVKQDLENGRLVLFSGTPCQVAGLYSYLVGEKQNLYTVEVVCHGVPLEEAYFKYIEEKSLSYGSEMCDINFRDKRHGWNRNMICEVFADGGEDTCQSTIHPHHSMYLKGINIESGCGACTYAKLPRIADITLADFWQYNGELLPESDMKGISLVAINSKNGEKIFEWTKKNLNIDKVEQECALASCKHMNNSPYVHPNQPAFQELIKSVSFGKASELCSQFGNVVLASDLYILNTKDVNTVFRTFMKDSHEIIYFTDSENRIQGITTFGEFTKAYVERKSWINCGFQSVCLYDEHCLLKIRNIFESNLKINRIPVIDENGRLLYEIRRLFDENGQNDSRRFILPFVRMAGESRKCFYYKRPDLLSDFEYSEDEKNRISNRISFPMLCDSIKTKEIDIDNSFPLCTINIDENNEEELKKILKERYSREYVSGLCKIPPIIKRGNRYQHADAYSEFVNVSGGWRRTCFQPEEFSYTIHIYGRCGVFGYAVEDADTMPSRLQKLVGEKKIKVVSHSTWGADDSYIIQNLNEDLADGVIAEQDFVLLYMNYLPIMDSLRRMGVYVNDTTQAYHEALQQTEIEFYDIPGHMNAEGYEFIATYIYKDLKGDLEAQLVRADQLLHVKNSECGRTLDTEQESEIREYIENIKKQIPMDVLEDKKVGSVVMNCNPFTRGHRYLIETAMKEVDTLLVFVVEEDKSEFSYYDRMEMVKCGVQDLDGVYVFPSGQYIISTYTLPDYFFWKQQKSTVINMNLDVEIFAKYIAPAFHITYRFLGTESKEEVTRHYNDTQKEILPEYGIVVRVIERLKYKDGYISAKTVRQSIREGNYEKLKVLLPESTIEYLKAKQYI